MLFILLVVNLTFVQIRMVCGEITSTTWRRTRAKGSQIFWLPFFWQWNLNHNQTRHARRGDPLSDGTGQDDTAVRGRPIAL